MNLLNFNYDLNNDINYIWYCIYLICIHIFQNNLNNIYYQKITKIIHKNIHLHLILT
jgi:hypothetical protein